MLYIYKIRDDHVIDFAAAELKKYLRMMMPEENLIRISADPKATTGFRLGLLEDFGMPNPAPDPVQDDIIHIDTTEDGGILAGSNPRSVLFAVYRFLKLNGCRFLFPGAEGERIPLKRITPQKYHKVADHRYRGRTIEGRPSYELVLQALDFYAKEELNVFGCYGVAGYHHGYYNHQNNEANREAEFFDDDFADIQWRAHYEEEAQKRGMLIFSGEHEMIPNALGLNFNDMWLYSSGEKQLPPEVIPYLAEIGGERKLFRDELGYTNVCMSKPDMRERMAQAVVKEIVNRPHLTVFGCTVGDLSNNHCECAECRKKIPSDWFVMILNRIDELLTEKGIPNKVSFAFYVDMIFAPETERLNNPDRFMLQYCPISRSYTASLKEDSVYPAPMKYVRNNWEAPKDQESLMALFNKWKEVYPGPCFVYEYHFWRHQYRDPGMQAMSRRLYEDVLSYRFTGMDGCIQDGSMRSYWPNAFHNHIYNETLMNRDLDYEAEYADFYESLYGKDWPVARDYLRSISDAFNHKYMSGEMSADLTQGVHYNPEHAKSLAKVEEITQKLLAFEKTVKPTHRVEYLGWLLLRYHAMYCAELAKVMTAKCQGDTPKAVEMCEAFYNDFGKYELLLERWFDFGLSGFAIKPIVKKMPKVEF